MNIQLRDVFSHLGHDYVVQGLVTYHLPGGKVHQLARAVDDEVVIWIEPPSSDAADRLVIMRQIKDLDMAIPPPSSILYRNLTYVPRSTGRATIEIAGEVPERAAGSAEIWRYRAAGDVALQIESTAQGLFVVNGDSVHVAMVDHLPAH